MRRVLLFATIFSCLSAYSQSKFVPEIKKDSRLFFSIITPNNETPLEIEIDSIGTNYYRFNWDIDGYGNGVWVIKQKSLESAQLGYWENPQKGLTETLPDDKSLLLLSKLQWNGIKKDKKMSYNNQVFNVKQGGQQSLNISGKELDLIFLEGEGGSKLWVLNSEKFPAIMKIQGNMMGPDMEIKGF